MIWLLLSLWIWSTVVGAAGRQCDPNVVTDDMNRFNFPGALCYWKNYTGINTYSLGTKLTIRWTTNASLINLALWQEGPTTSSSMELLASNLNNSTSSYDFSGFPSQPLSAGITFFFATYIPGQTGALFFSDYINITDPAATTSSPSSSITTSNPQSTSTSVPAGSSTSLPSSASPKSNNTGRDVGIGVGVGLGSAVLVGAAAVWFFFRRREAARGPAGAAENYGPPSLTGNNKMAIAAANQEMRYSHQYPPQYRPAEMEHPHERDAMLSNTGVYATQRESMPPAELSSIPNAH